MNDKQTADAEIVQNDAEQHGSSQLAVPSDILPGTLYLLPLSERPFFPAQAVPMLMNEEPWLETVQKIGSGRPASCLSRSPTDPDVRN